MSNRNQLELLSGGLETRAKASARQSARSASGLFLDKSRVIAAAIFVVTVGAILLISSAGLNTYDLPIQAGQIATVREVASTPFSYASSERTAAAQEQMLRRVPPIYRIDLDPFRQFQAATDDLRAQLDAFARNHPGPVVAPTLRPELQGIADRFNARGPYHVTVEDLAGLLETSDPAMRAVLFENGLAALRDIYSEGVRDDALGSSGAGAVVFEIEHPNGSLAPRPVQSLEEALTFLRVSLALESANRLASQAAFRFFRNGVAPNVVFDAGATAARENAAAAAMKPVTVNVPRGQVIVEPGQRVTPDAFEMLTAHRKYLREHADMDRTEGLVLLGRVLLVFAMIFASLIYIQLEDPETLRSNVRLALLALVVIFNLALIRAVYSLGGADFFIRDGSWASTLPYVAPTALAPLIVAILIDAGSAIFMALFISIFTGVIYGNRLDLLVLTFLASLVTIFTGRDARRRGKLVRGAAAGGLTVAAFAALIGIADQTPVATLVRQMVAGVTTGVLTGVAVVGLLPVLESLFKRTTDITLLELTDYNHPLLRRMQLEAPGTYHHSLVVAQLAENACNAIGANPLLARVCALFHDVGKTENADYFGENQRDRASPHASRDPAESARIIRQHVPDGVDLALKHRLPTAVVNVIQQHHGTTLVRYFYLRAVEAARRNAALPPGPAVTESTVPFSPTSDLVDPEPYRYPGPKPNAKESAIIHLADGVEAAARCLRQVTAAQLGSLIDRLVRERVEEGQLDEAPLTFEELTKIKNSFTFTLLNMLHTRVDYPKGEAPAAAHA